MILQNIRNMKSTRKREKKGKILLIYLTVFLVEKWLFSYKHWSSSTSIVGGNFLLIDASCSEWINACLGVEVTWIFLDEVEDEDDIFQKMFFKDIFF